MNRYKNVKYNGFLLSDICDIEEIRLPILPSNTISTIDIVTRDGEVFNGKRYKSYVIEIDILIDCDTKEECNDRLRELRDAFDVDEPKPFSINDDRFILAILQDAIEKEPVAFHSYTSTIKLLCPEPYFYSNEVKLAEGEGKEVVVTNSGNRPVLPIVQVGFSTDAYFAQLELDSTGQRVLVGKYPKLNLPSVKKSTKVLYDECHTTSTWTTSNASIDSDRTTGGTLAMNSSGESVIIGSLPSGDTTWKGVCVRQNLEHSVDEFKLKAKVRHNSRGKNGDPTVFDEDKQEVISGKITKFWEVTWSSLNVRTGARTNYKKLGTLKKGYKIKNGTETKGWVKFTYNGKDGYCSKSGLTNKVEDNRVTTTQKNMMAYNTTGKGYGTSLLAEPKHDAKVLCSIQTGTILRVITSKKYRHDFKKDGKPYYSEFYKLAKKYNGYDGYVNVANLLSANDTTIEYDELEGIDTADDKTGILEIYGFDTNGVKLFCFGMYDDNKWYEYTYPKCIIGNRTVLKSSEAPAPKQKRTTTGDGDKTVKLTNRLSGRHGDWNEFYGDLIISREKEGNKYVWNVSVIKDDGKTQHAKNIKYTDLPTNPLSYVVLYMGTTGTLEKSSAMSLNHIEVQELNPKSDNEDKNIVYFKEGDILEIDCENHRCFLNDEPCDDLVDIGSRYFEVPAGESTINVHSNDDGIVTGVVYREKWLGE